MIRTGNVDSLFYVCTDHLGSITALVNEQGTVVERHSYDAWGRERNPNDWSSYTVAAGRLDRGYTTHEHLREFGLINMNGRVYDPILGRMLSPDNDVQNPFDSQNYNRYTYCLNNPLILIDPTGYTWLSKWVYVVDGVVTTVVLVAVCATGNFELVIPTIGAGLNVMNNADNIKVHPGNFFTFYAIGGGCSYLSTIGAGPLVGGIQNGLNDLARGETQNIGRDITQGIFWSTASLALGDFLNQIGIGKTLSYALGNMTSTYLSSSYDPAHDKFDWSLTLNKTINMTVSGAMGGLSTDAKFQVPKSMCIKGNLFTNFEFPSLGNSVTPNVLIPYIPTFNLPNYYPGMPTPTSPLPPPVITTSHN